MYSFWLFLMNMLVIRGIHWQSTAVVQCLLARRFNSYTKFWRTYHIMLQGAALSCVWSCLLFCHAKMKKTYVQCFVRKTLCECLTKQCISVDRIYCQKLILLMISNLWAMHSVRCSYDMVYIYSTNKIIYSDATYMIRCFTKYLIKTAKTLKGSSLVECES